MVDELNTRSSVPYAPATIEADLSDLNRLLGNKGEFVLAQVIELVNSVAGARHWPLKRIEVDLYQDPEVALWEYVVVVLVFDAPFKAADGYLRQLYLRLAKFNQALSEEELELFRRLIYFDVDTV